VALQNIRINYWLKNKKVTATMFKQRFNAAIFYFSALNEKGMGNSPNYYFTKLLQCIYCPVLPVKQQHATGDSILSIYTRSDIDAIQHKLGVKCNNV
jgi:hypothetical protein